MKHFLILTGILLMLAPISFGQDTNIVYKVTNYEINGINYDQLALESDIALSFYMCDENTLCFTNHWRETNSQSYGGVHALKSREIPETATDYGALEIKFTWNYYNTYDSNSGKAVVTIQHIMIGNTLKFAAEIVLMETNEILKFKGYLE
ncbi:MAG: hypothetical protein R2757_03475 [Draconibacterium sp.]